MSGFKPGNDNGKDTRFKPGQSGNPGGLAKGTRNRLNAAFLNSLADDFQKFGTEAIVKCREQDPVSYVRVLASLLPKEVDVKRPLEEMEDADLIAAVRALEGYLAARSAPQGDESPGESPTLN